MKNQNYNPSSKNALALWLRLVCVFILSTLTYSGIQATVLINPAAEGGFENGTTFASNGWTVTNGTAVNKWFLGTAPAALPAGYTNRVAFVSSDSGLTNTYSQGANSTIHFYRDVVLPAGEASINLTFDWSGQGEDGWDFTMVSIAPTSVTVTGSATFPGSGTTLNGIPGSTVIAALNLSGTRQTATIAIPQSALSF